jgi:arylsulfatase
LPAFADKPIARGEPLFFEHEGSRGVRDGDWKLVSLSGNAWELYNFKTDPSEMTNLITAEPARSKSLIAKWEAWARRCNVDTTTDLLGMSVGAQEVSSEDSLHIFTPTIANREIVIACEVTPDPAKPNGVILAQGGKDNGYALHISSGQLIFSVRETGLLTSIQGQVPTGTFSVEAKLERGGKMSLSINGKPAVTGKAPGLIRGQPLEILTITEDSGTAVGRYRAPNAFKGKVEKLDIQTIPAAGNQ